MALKAAQSFGEYAASGDSKKERELIEILSKRPSLMERFFPTKGQVINQEVIAQRLKQLIQDQIRVSDILSETYIENLKIIANVNISKLRTNGQAALAVHYENTSTTIQKILLESQKKHRLYLMESTKQAKIDFADDEDFLNGALADIKTVFNANRISTDKIINEFLSSLDKKFT